MTTSRSHVLLAWEYGRNLGHVSRLTAMAGLLQQAGARITWAVPQAWQHAVPADGGDWQCVVSPRLACRQPAERTAPQSFADILASFGFLDAAALQLAVRRWMDLFDRLAIDRVVLDYAPAAQLAAMLCGLPALQITNGFDAPPPECPVFGIGMRGPMLERRNAVRVDELNRTISAVAQARGGSPTSLGELLAHPQRWYDCIAETDPYGPRNDGVYMGPIGRPPEAASVQWPDGPDDASKVFAYLRQQAQVDAVLAALQGLGARAIVAWPGATAAEISRRQRPGVTLVGQPVNLAEVLPQCTAVVNYGSTTLVCQTLMAGKPQLMLPTDAEKWLVAKRVEQLGVGVIDGPTITYESAERVLAQCLAVSYAATSIASQLIRPTPPSDRIYAEPWSHDQSIEYRRLK